VEDRAEQEKLTAYAADIISAYVRNHAVPPSDLPGLIATVRAALTGIATGAPKIDAVPLTPAVPVKKSVTADAIVCLEDGKSFTSLKRHLMTKHGMTPDEYRTKWGLAADYPMVPPNYAEARSKLAKKSGLGQLRPKSSRSKAAKTVE
jgi:predicted transcriptional regulator